MADNSNRDGQKTLKIFCSATLALAPGHLFTSTTGMFLRAKTRFKDAKQHRYWSIVESRRIAGGRVVQRYVLYLGKIKDSKKAAWRRSN